MQFPESWLRALVNPALSTEELAHKLTMAGLEVESVVAAGSAFNGVVVGEVMSVEPHPGADRLKICKVNVGEVEPLQIVCGAPNVAVGQKVPCARTGAKLPNMEIRQAKVRGVESFGMLCGASEIGLQDKVDGLLVLDANAPVGKDVRLVLGMDDRVLTLKLTPNRADCLSVAGIAREVGAVTGARVSLPTQPPVVQEIYDTHEIDVRAPEACARYAGRVIKGINAKAKTPDWMVFRLEQSGIRCISAPVDVTNYVLLELGQPLHAFDLSKLEDKIQVRWAHKGETLELLNGQKAELSDDILVIADAKGPLALAGIMGGAASAVSDATTDIFLEAAWFSPAAIAGRARRLGLATDSSHRFERGVDYANTLMVLERATKLILEVCGGQPGPVLEKKSSSLPKREAIRLRPDRVVRVLGESLSSEAMRNLLQVLGLSVKQEADILYVTPPSYRFDLSIEEDLIEEIARLHGYDQIAPQAPRAAAVMQTCSEKSQSQQDLRRYLNGRDYQEVITYSFVDPDWVARLAPVHKPLALQNPIASQMAVMRTTLWGGLIQALSHNLNRQQQRVRLFELGRAYQMHESGVRQPMMLAGLCHGQAFDEQWGLSERKVDFYDVRGDLEHWPGVTMQFVPEVHPALHPGQSARILVQERAIGWLGTLHPRLAEHFDLGHAPILFEIELDALGERALPRHQSIPRFPSVRRDLALVVDNDLSAAELLSTLQAAASALVRDITVFDVYRGEGVSEGQKSLAIRILMQDTERTLTDVEVDETVAKLAEAAASAHGAQLRS